MPKRITRLWIAALALGAVWSAQPAMAQTGRRPVSAQPQGFRDGARALRSEADDLDDAARDLYIIVRREISNPDRDERYALGRVADFADESAEFSSHVDRRGWEGARREFDNVAEAYQDMRATFDDLRPSRAAWAAYREAQSEYEDVRRILTGRPDERDGLTQWQREYLQTVGAQIESFSRRAFDLAERDHRVQWFRRPERLDQLNRMSDLTAAARAFRAATQDPRASSREITNRYNELARAYEYAAPRGWMFGRTVGSMLNSIGDRLQDVERTLRRR